MHVLEKTMQWYGNVLDKGNFRTPEPSLRFETFTFQTQIRNIKLFSLMTVMMMSFI